MIYPQNTDSHIRTNTDKPTLTITDRTDRHVWLQTDADLSHWLPGRQRGFRSLPTFGAPGRRYRLTARLMGRIEDQFEVRFNLRSYPKRDP